MLFGSSMLEVGVGMAFVYLLLAILVSSINEVVARGLRLRWRNLQSGVRQLVGDPQARSIARQLMAHPMIRNLEKQGRPSYVSAKQFSGALIDVVSAGAGTYEAFKTQVATNTDLPADLRSQLQIIVDRADGTLAGLQSEIGDWFDDSMGRVGGWYKRKMQVVTFVVSLVIVVFINADSLRLANGMLQNPAARDAFVGQASALVPATGAEPALYVDQVKRALQPVGIDLGWPDITSPDLVSIGRYALDVPNWFGRVPGWLVTVFAMLMGAPFWFDVIRRVANVSSAGDPPRRAGSTD